MEVLTPNELRRVVEHISGAYWDTRNLFSPVFLRIESFWRRLSVNKLELMGSIMDGCRQRIFHIMEGKSPDHASVVHPMAF